MTRSLRKFRDKGGENWEGGRGTMTAVDREMKWMENAEMGHGGSQLGSCLIKVCHMR